PAALRRVVHPSRWLGEPRGNMVAVFVGGRYVKMRQAAHLALLKSLVLLTCLSIFGASKQTVLGPTGRRQFSFGPPSSLEAGRCWKIVARDTDAIPVTASRHRLFSLAVSPLGTSLAAAIVVVEDEVGFLGPAEFSGYSKLCVWPFSSGARAFVIQRRGHVL